MHMERRDWVLAKSGFTGCISHTALLSLRLDPWTLGPLDPRSIIPYSSYVTHATQLLPIHSIGYIDDKNNIFIIDIIIVSEEEIMVSTPLSLISLPLEFNPHPNSIGTPNSALPAEPTRRKSRCA